MSLSNSVQYCLLSLCSRWRHLLLPFSCLIPLLVNGFLSSLLWSLFPPLTISNLACNQDNDNKVRDKEDKSKNKGNLWNPNKGNDNKDRLLCLISPFLSHSLSDPSAPIHPSYNLQPMSFHISIWWSSQIHNVSNLCFTRYSLLSIDQLIQLLPYLFHADFNVISI